MKKGQTSKTNGIENFLCPVTDMYITQGAGGSYSHAGTMAVDIRGLEPGVRYAYYAPCSVKCIKTYSSSGQVMWQSQGNVRCANGYVGVVTFMTVHDDTMDATPGQLVPQGAQLGNMGTKGNATGVHLHFESAQTGSTAWTKNSYGNWNFPNGEKDIDEMCFMNDTNIMNCPSLKPIYVNEPADDKKKYGSTTGRDENNNQIEILADNVRARKSPSGDIIGYMNKGIYNYLEVSNNGGYNWYKVGDNLWFASGDWCNIYPKKKASTLGTPVSRNSSVRQIEILAENVRARKSPNGDLWGTYVAVGIYNILDSSQSGDYNWIKLENDLWCAYSSDWAKIYEVNQPEEPKDYKLKGIDISHHQREIDLSKIDYDFVIMKCTEGVGYKDDKFDDFYNTAKSLNKKIGIYHNCRPDLGNNAEDEAKWFLETISNIKEGNMIILDMEPKSINISWAKSWLDYIYKKTGTRPIIYIGDSMENDNDWSSIANDYPLWIASYGSNNGNPGVRPDTKYWKNYIIWQYTDKGSLNNYSGNVDLNYFYEDNWEDYVVKSKSPEPIPEPIDDKDKEIESLKEEIAKLNKEIESLKDDNGEIIYSKYISKDDLYAIKIHSGETIIIKTTKE